MLQFHRSTFYHIFEKLCLEFHRRKTVFQENSKQYMVDCYEEDLHLIQNCVHVLERIKPDKIFSTWSCTKSNPPGFYIITSHISDRDFEFSVRELETVHEVNPLRVIAVLVCRHGGTNCVQIKISDKNQPIVLTETQITHIRKRARWSFT